MIDHRIVGACAFLVLTASAPKPTAIPSTTELSRALADSNDWRAILIVAVVVIAMLMGFIAWRELGLSRLAKALDGVTNALWALRLGLAEKGIKADEEPPK